MRSIRKLLAFALLAAAHAHSSCCTKHLQYIPDPEEMPPDEFEGQPRLIPDPADMKPAGWDDDDDGPWQPRDKVNPAFAWRARLVPNPEYQPPGFFKAVQTELLKAAPWVLIGLGVTVALEALQLPLEGLSGLLKHAGPFTGAIVGLATPLCSCGMLPVAAGFVGAGVPLDVVVSFLTASQSAGLDSAAITWGLLGRDAALCRLGGAVALATAAGLAASGAAAAAQAAAPAKSAPAKAAEGAAAGGLLVRLWRAALNSAADGARPICIAPAISPPPLSLTRLRTHAAPSLASSRSALTPCLPWAPSAAVFPSLFMGLFLSAALGQLLPSLRTAYVALRPAAVAGPAGELATRLAVLGSALPLQLCEHSTVTCAHPSPALPSSVSPGVVRPGASTPPPAPPPSPTALTRCSLGTANLATSPPYSKASPPPLQTLPRQVRGPHPAGGWRPRPRLRLSPLRTRHQPTQPAAAAARGGRQQVVGGGARRGRAHSHGARPLVRGGRARRRPARGAAGQGG